LTSHAGRNPRFPGPFRGAIHRLRRNKPPSVKSQQTLKTLKIWAFRDLNSPFATHQFGKPQKRGALADLDFDMVKEPDKKERRPSMSKSRKQREREKQRPQRRQSLRRNNKDGFLEPSPNCLQDFSQFVPRSALLSSGRAFLPRAKDRSTRQILIQSISRLPTRGLSPCEMCNPSLVYARFLAS
jgi:hypothetical protein